MTQKISLHVISPDHFIVSFGGAGNIHIMCDGTVIATAYQDGNPHPVIEYQAGGKPVVPDVSTRVVPDLRALRALAEPVPEAKGNGAAPTYVEVEPEPEIERPAPPPTGQIQLGPNKSVFNSTPYWALMGRHVPANYHRLQENYRQLNEITGGNYTVPDELRMAKRWTRKDPHPMCVEAHERMLDLLKGWRAGLVKPMLRRASPVKPKKTVAYRSHVLGKTAPPGHHPMRYGYDRLNARKTSTSGHALLTYIRDCNTLMGTNIPMKVGDANDPIRQHQEVRTILQAWWQDYTTKNYVHGNHHGKTNATTNPV